MARALSAALVAAWCFTPVASIPISIEVGDVRVQPLSPLLFRVETKGKWGFEDRNTFMVQDRSYTGLDYNKTVQEDNNTRISTRHYTIILLRPGGFMVFDTQGTEVYNTAKDGNTKKNLLHWPSPNMASAYAVVDSPRFAVPDWTVSPCCPAGVEVEDYLKKTNGYDFGNDVDGDTYVFLLGHGIDGWNAARAEFARLTGPVPVLPDYAFGSWFTWWHFYDEGLAKWEVSNWTNHKVPLDVWGLDMNWRFTTGGQDKAYDHPNTSAFPDMQEWFNWLKDSGIHTYFNDHPFQQAPQTSPQEVGFRWNGLTSWLQKGLSFWWFDHNWKFSIGPPNGPPAGNSPTYWKGLSTTAWGSHVYWEATDHYNRYSRADDLFAGGRTIALSMTTPRNEISGFSLANPLHSGSWGDPIDPFSVAESPAHHRYPVWWNGDFTTMNNDVEMMVDAGVHDFKPYVHPDCGGDGWFVSVAQLLRQTQMCSFGTILRFHGGPHQPWIYGSWWEGIIRKYINYRYSFMPMLIAAGYRANKDGFPFVARADLYWPGVDGSDKRNHQYIFLDDILVAPIWDRENNTARKVWIPPGRWMNVWDGVVDYGPKEVENWFTWERQPMYMRLDGGLLIYTDKPGLRVAQGDWSTLTVEAYPCVAACTKTRTIFERTVEIDAQPSTTNVTLSTDGSGEIRVELGVNTEGLARGWTVRVNLNVGEEVTSSTLDGTPVHVTTIHAKKSDDGTPWCAHWPWLGKDSVPASKANAVVQLSVAPSSVRHTVKLTVAKSAKACSWDGDDCRYTTCCRVSGSNCYEKSKFWATCQQDCTPGVHNNSVDDEPWTCKVLGSNPDVIPAAPAPLARATAGMSLFCFSVHLTLEAWQKAVIEAQKMNGYGIHACNHSKVYAGVQSSDNRRLSDVEVVPRPYTKVWREVLDDGIYMQYDWTVKADVDAVFVPARLVQHLRALRPSADAAIYIKNSEAHGIAGPLKVLSMQALRLYSDNEESCSKQLGHYGEDFYFVTCMDAIGAKYMKDYKMVYAIYDQTDTAHSVRRLYDSKPSCGVSPFAAFYPIREADDWLACYKEASLVVVRTLSRSLLGLHEVPTRIGSLLSAGFMASGAVVAFAAVMAIAALRRRKSRRESSNVQLTRRAILPQEEETLD